MNEVTRYTSMAPPRTSHDRLVDVPELMEDGNREFMARNLVQQAQREFAQVQDQRDAAIEAQRQAELAVRRAEGRERIANLAKEAETQRVEFLEGMLRKHQPQIRQRLMSPLFATERPARVEYEPTWLWLATSVACIVGGIAMVLL